MIKHKLIFTLKKKLNFFKKIITNKGTILIIYLNSDFMLLKKFLKIKQFFIITEWSPGILTNNPQKKPDLILFFNNENNRRNIMNEILLSNIPLFFFNKNRLNFCKNSLVYFFKFKVSMKTVFIYLMLIDKYINKKLKKYD